MLFGGKFPQWKFQLRLVNRPACGLGLAIKLLVHCWTKGLSQRNGLPRISTLGRRVVIPDDNGISIAYANARSPMYSLSLLEQQLLEEEGW
ncbi:jg9547 [Pararge aegeria aegeria]|uniref:Jg9547 protein n=1 Tax=Pararge aegeria aegeria TaxID=348720 RepID=A0A8S4RIJ2_9NEOP|nr:jg9547 [Pararge aegeria aegeria]